MATAASPATVLVVDDNEGLTRLMRKVLEREGFSAVTANSGQEAIAWLIGNHADLLLLDLKLPDIEGKALVDHLAEIRRPVPFIVITGQGDERVAVDMMKRGALDYLVKDVDFLQFVPAVVRRALDQQAREKRLAEAEEQARLGQTVVEQGYSAVLIISTELPDPRVVYVNPAFADLTGCAVDEVTGQRLSRLEKLTSPMPELRQALSTERAFSGERAFRRRDGGQRVADCYIAPVLDPAGQCTHWVAIQRDITALRRLEKEGLEVAEREQRRIGQDLHDGLGQRLTAIELMCESLRSDLASLRPGLEKQAAQVCQFLRETIRQTRSLAHGLAPFKVDAGGLEVALTELAQTASAPGRVRCRVECPAPVLLEDNEAAAHLYRIAQEAVNNAVRHSQASELTIHLSQRNGAWCLQVTDNGQGLPKTRPERQGMGLEVMKHRASVIGAELSVESSPGQGVTILCRLRRNE